jgi:type III secretory pathway lipoprotein EscJ
MHKASRERWVLLYSAADGMEGNIVLNLLRDAGVHALPHWQGHIYVRWTSPVDILVPQEELEHAQQVLNRAKEAAEPKEGDNGHYGE